MKRMTIYMIAFLAIFMGCSRMSEEELLSKAEAAMKLNKPEEAIVYYQDMVNLYPKSEKTPEALFALGSLYKGVKNDIPRALGVFNKIVDEYPTYEKAPQVLFLIGFIYNNELKDMEKARATYERFLKQYGSHELAKHAQYELENLGKDPNTLLPPQNVTK
jgi:TolA-binding protein